jgi:hypothetical protein
MFSLLDDSCKRFNLGLCIKTIHLDFEDRMHVTVTNLFPDVVIRSCRFHLSQAWWRKIQALGLAKEYKKNVTDISKWLHHFLAHLAIGHMSFCHGWSSVRPLAFHI